MWTCCHKSAGRFIKTFFQQWWSRTSLLSSVSHTCVLIKNGLGHCSQTSKRFSSPAHTKGMQLRLRTLICSFAVLIQDRLSTKLGLEVNGISFHSFVYSCSFVLPSDFMHEMPLPVADQLRSEGLLCCFSRHSKTIPMHF